MTEKTEDQAPDTLELIARGLWATHPLRGDRWELELDIIKVECWDQAADRLAALTTHQEAKWEHGVIGGDDLLARLMDTLAYYHCRSVNPKADSPYLGYHAMSEDQREFLREKQREAAEEVLRMWHAESRPPAPQEGDARERLLYVLTLDENPDVGDWLWAERRDRVRERLGPRADAILAAFPVLSRDIAGEIEADKHPVADERVEFFNAGLDRAAEIVRNGR